jgi:hypothetical protein
MAKIHEEILIIKLSKLVRNDQDSNNVVTADLVESLQAVAQELAGNSVIVEVERTDG